MSVNKPVVLFIGHNAGRSGAPVLLLELIREFSNQCDLPFAILLKKGGELISDYHEAGTTFIWEEPQPGIFSSPITRIFNRGINYISRSYRRFRIGKKIDSARVVFVNTMVNGDLLQQLKFAGSRIITYVHELEMAITENTSPATLQTVLNRTRLFFAGSGAVKNNLVYQHGVSPDKIEVYYSSLPVLVRNRQHYSVQTSMLRAQNNIGTGEIIIGVVAGAEWRKGIDFFMPLVNLYGHLFPNDTIHFVWMGVKTGSPLFTRILHDYSRIKCSNKVHFLNHGSDYLPTMAAFDIHLLLSREDPFPLVVLDAATFGTPTICFSDAGGAPEFVGTDCGYCVPFGDLFETANTIHHLYADAEHRKLLGESARGKVQSAYGQKEVVEKIITHINSML